MEKVLILGNKGMLGHVLYRTFLSDDISKKFQVFGVNRSDRQMNKNSYKLNVLDSDNLEQFIIKKKPKYIINCIGTLVESSINNPSIAIQTNSFLPHFLNEISEKYSFKLIHISTDCVFDGKKDGMYKESDNKTETNYYGLSKNLGEINNLRNLTIRTSIIGPELKLKPTGFFEWIMSQDGMQVNGYSNAMWSGLTTIELSKFIIWCLNKDINGIIHATNGIGISKFDLIKMITKIFNLNVNLINDKSFKINKTLKNTKISNYNFPSYKQMIKEMKKFINKY